MKRRELLHTAVVAGTGVAVARFSSATSAEDGKFRIIDSNVSLFRCPFRRLPLDDTKLLLTKMRSLGIATAFAGSFEGILQRDIATVNERLAAECRGFPELIPIGSLNPNLPGWEDDWRSCLNDHGMHGIRLHPNYHGYELTDRRFLKLLKLAESSGVFVQIAALFEDVRTQPETLRIPDVDLSPLVTHAIGRIQILNWRPRGELFEKLAAIPQIHFDISRIDQTDGVATLLQTVPENRVLFGTHAPFLIPEASLIRVHESALSENSLHSVLEANATTFLNG